MNDGESFARFSHFALRNIFPRYTSGNGGDDDCGEARQVVWARSKIAPAKDGPLAMIILGPVNFCHLNARRTGETVVKELLARTFAFTSSLSGLIVSFLALFLVFVSNPRVSR